MTIIEFRDQRLNDDLHRIDDAIDVGAPADPAADKIRERAVREVQAKRIIIDETQGQSEWMDSIDTAKPADLTDDTYLRALGTIYSDHPDFKPEWTIEP